MLIGAQNDVLSYLTNSQTVRRGSRPRGDGTQLLEPQQGSESALKSTDSTLQNDRVPVNRLPSEILLRVFGLIIFPLSKGYFSYIFIFSHVCKRWRSVVTSSPLFWTTISAGPLTQPGFITLQLQCSGRLPLTLSLQLIDCHCNPDPSFDDAYLCPHGNNQDFGRLLELFTPHRDRIATLDIRYGKENREDVLKHPFFCAPLPNLERLSWVSRSLGTTGKRGDDDGDDDDDDDGDSVITSTNIFSDSLPRLRELVLVNTWGLISAAGPNLKTLKVQHLGPGRDLDTALSMPGLRDFLSRHPLLTSVSLGDITPQVDEDGGSSIEMRHLTSLAFTPSLIELEPHPTLRCLRFGAFGPMETLIIRWEVKNFGDDGINPVMNATWVDKNGHDISCSFGIGEPDPLGVWDALCNAGICDEVTVVELKGPYVKSAASEPFLPLFERRLPRLRTIRMAWGKPTAEEVKYGKLDDSPPPNVSWAASYLGPILRCRAAIGKPVHLLERLVEGDEDPADSRFNDLVWEQYLCRAFNLQKYLK